MVLQVYVHHLIMSFHVHTCMCVLSCAHMYVRAFMCTRTSARSPKGTVKRADVHGCLCVKSRDSLHAVMSHAHKSVGMHVGFTQSYAAHCCAHAGGCSTVDATWQQMQRRVKGHSVWPTCERIIVDI
jgi:hypothetical protein